MIQEHRRGSVANPSNIPDVLRCGLGGVGPVPGARNRWDHCWEARKEAAQKEGKEVKEEKVVRRGSQIWGVLLGAETHTKPGRRSNCFCI